MFKETLGPEKSCRNGNEKKNKQNSEKLIIKIIMRRADNRNPSTLHFTAICMIWGPNESPTKREMT